MRTGGVALVLVLVCFSICPGSSLRLVLNGRSRSKHTHAAARHRSKHARAAAGQCRSPPDPWTYEPTGGHTIPHYLGTSTDQDCIRLHGNEAAAGGVPEWTKWRFAPPGASDWRDFNPQTFCKALVDRAQVPGKPRMLFVGDSLSRDHLYSLLLELGARDRGPNLTGKQISAKTWSEDDYAYVWGGKHDGALACDGRAWMQQFGSLSLLTDYAEQFRFEDHLPWLRSFDVVVLQVPWQVPPGPGARFWRSAALPHQRVLFRAPTVGQEGTGVAYNATWDEHINPMLKSRKHSAPLKSPEEVVKLCALQGAHPSWLNKREETEDLMLELEREGASVADFFYLTAMMWYHHLDPLHYCVPGPQERWNDVLFNWLVRGHLRDFQDWSWKFSRAVSALGGLRNEDGVAYSKNGTGHNKSAVSYEKRPARHCLDAEAAA